MAILYPVGDTHDHGYPICSHFEYPDGYPLTHAVLERSRQLSALAGYPADVSAEDAEATALAYGVPYEAGAGADPGGLPTVLYLQLGVVDKTLVIAGGDFAGLIALRLTAEGTSVTFTGTGLAYDPDTAALTGTLTDSSTLDGLVDLVGAYDADASDATQIVFVYQAP